MAETIPPINNWYSGSPFNTNNWIVPQDGITIEYANANYLKFPVSQSQTESITSLKVIGTTDSTNITTGSFQCLGGIGITKNAYVGGQIIATSDITGANLVGGSVTAFDASGNLNQMTPDYIYYNKLTTNYTVAPPLSGDDIGTILSTSAFVANITTTLANISAVLTSVPMGTYILNVSFQCAGGTTGNIGAYFYRNSSQIGQAVSTLYNTVAAISTSFSFIYQNTSSASFSVKAQTTVATIPILGGLFQMTRIA